LHTGNNTQNVTKLRSSPANPALPQRFYLRKRLNSLALQAKGTFYVQTIKASRSPMKARG
jgi:hypothetical protein